MAVLLARRAISVRNGVRCSIAVLRVPRSRQTFELQGQHEHSTVSYLSPNLVEIHAPLHVFSRFFSSRSTDPSPSAESFSRETVRGPHGSYAEEYALSLLDPETFWAKAAEELHWYEKPTKILEQSDQHPSMYRWFTDGVINTCYNCLDVHVINGKGSQDAIVYDSPVTNTKRRITYSEMLDQVSRFAGALLDIGVEKSDRVIIYMPMIPEALIAMLACTRIGAIHSVVFGGFASAELATRITDCQPRVIVSASAGVEGEGRVVPYKPLLDKALELSNHSVETCIIVQRENVQTCELGPMDLDFEQVMSTASSVEAVPLPSTHIHYILYTSGTTGFPKGVVRDMGGWATALKYSMSKFYDTCPGETYWAASDIGWTVGHAYTVYAPLLHGCTTVLYEGKPVGTPDAGAFWRVIEEYGVKTFFVAPTAFRAIKQADPSAELLSKYDLSCLKYLFLAGEHSDPATLHWCENALKKYKIPAIDHWWQTELGWPGVGNAVGLGRFPVRYGACAAPVPGYDLRILDDDGKEVPPGQLGNMVIKLPLPPGTLPTLYNNDQRYIDIYMTKFPGYYDTSDAAFMDKDGYTHIMGRTDDVINTAGHRLSTGDMEEILMEHPDIAECAVIGARDKLKGEVPVGFVVTNAGCAKDTDIIRKELIELVREKLGPVASFKKVAIVKGLPKTRSGKTLRGTMKKIADGEDYTITPTIDDAKIFDYLEPEIHKLMKE